MVRNIHFHISIAPSLLDKYLANGWYRIGPFVFTTNHIDHPDASYRVFWLRYNIRKFQCGSKQERLMKALSRFSISVKPLRITEELELLFAKYRSAIDFNTSETIYKLLYDELAPSFIPPSLFNSQMVEIRDGEKLIAAGVLDLGENSSAGIVNFYDPSYKKYSLGKCLMLIKMEFSRNKGMEFYYPGYIAVDLPKFDYKLFADEAAAEIFDPVSQHWLPYSRRLIEELREYLPAPGINAINEGVTSEKANWQDLI
jgi:arginyl-tRNA--protein-N-Asp/Glu arginylyltransferase